MHSNFRLAGVQFLTGALPFFLVATRYSSFQTAPQRNSNIVHFPPIPELAESLRLHTSVIERVKRVPAYKPVNLPPAFRVEK